MWIARRSTCRFPPGVEVGVGLGLDSSLVPGSPAMVSRLHPPSLCPLCLSHKVHYKPLPPLSPSTAPYWETHRYCPMRKILNEVRSQFRSFLLPFLL